MSVHNHRTKELSYREERVPCPKCIELLNALAEAERLREQGWRIEGDAGGTVEAHADDAPLVSPSPGLHVHQMGNWSDLNDGAELRGCRDPECKHMEYRIANDPYDVMVVQPPATSPERKPGEPR